MLSVWGELQVISAVSSAVGDDRVPRLVVAWLLGHESQTTRRNYVLDMAARLGYCGDHDIDLLTARSAHLDVRDQAMRATLGALGAVAQGLGGAPSWYRYLATEGVRPDLPARHLLRSKIRDRCETCGLTRDELRRLSATAKRHRSKRSLPLPSLLAQNGPWINEALNQYVKYMVYHRGHRVLGLELKGDREYRTVLTAQVAHRLDDYLDDRSTGPLFVAKTVEHTGLPEALRMVRRFACRAALEVAGKIRPHSLREAFVPGDREAGVPLGGVQDSDPLTTRPYWLNRYPDQHASCVVTVWLCEPLAES